MSPLYATGHGFRFQISEAYCVIVRSLENFPDAATFNIAFRAQASCLPYNSISAWSCFEVGFQISQVHIVIAAALEEHPQLIEDARFITVEMVGKDQVQRSRVSGSLS